ncbi:MAG: hypothetical protein ACUVQG_03715 [Thermogutta sp.]
MSFAIEISVYAQQRRALEAMRREFQRRAAGDNTTSGYLGWVLGGFVVFVAVIVIVSWVVNRFRERRPYFSHTLLFLELSCVHKLKLRDILFLWKWTSRERIRPRALIFVDPALWENKINPALVAAGAAIPQTEWDRLYARLFGNLVLPNTITEAAGATSVNPSAPG